MKTAIPTKSLAKTLVCAAIILACTGSQAAEVVSADTLADKVVLQNVRLEGQTVRGEVVNKSDHRVDDVQLLIAYNWLWRNEFKPGAQSPAWATTMVLPEPLAPNESYEFTFEPERALDSGDDGSFYPSVDIVGLTEYSRLGQ